MPKQSKKKIDLPKPGPDASGKMPPNSVEIEAAVLGALMASKEAYGMVADNLTAQCFYDNRHSFIFEAVQALANQDAPTDYLAVAEQLRLMGKLEEVGALPYLMELTNNIASTYNLQMYVNSIVSKARARELISLAGQIATQAYDETIPVEDTMQYAEAGIFEITQQTYKREVLPIGEIVATALEKIQLVSQNEGIISGVPTGFNDLDKLTAGWQNSDLIIIAARPAMGKTAFVISMAKNIAVNNKIPVAMFSLEMPNVQLANRIFMNMCEISGEKLKNGKITNDEWTRLENSATELVNAPLYIEDSQALSIFELRSKARKMKKKYDIGLLIIDYLQLLNASGVGSYNSNREQEVAYISRSLKALAKELNIPIIALSQLNRSLEGRMGIEGKKPQLSDLRESGAIEQDADIVCFIHRPEYYKIYQDDKGNNLRGLAQLIVAKHRNGATDEITLRFISKYAKFQNLGDMYDELDFPIDEPEGQTIVSTTNMADYEDDPLR